MSDTSLAPLLYLSAVETLVKNVILQSKLSQTPLLMRMIYMRELLERKTWNMVYFNVTYFDLLPYFHNTEISNFAFLNDEGIID